MNLPFALNTKLSTLVIKYNLRHSCLKQFR